MPFMGNLLNELMGQMKLSY